MSTSLSAVVGVLPVFLLAGLVVLMRRELGFDEAALGMAVGAFFLASALASVPGGRLAERLGARRALLVSRLAGSLSLAGIALLTVDWWTLVAFLLLAGAANGVVQPATNLALARGIAGRHQSFAFGAKHAAVPAAALIGGLALPLVGLTVGWRWAFGGAAVLALLWPTIPDRSATLAPTQADRRLREGDVALRPLLLLALAAGFGAGAANSMTTFLVESSVAAGLSPESSGLLLATGGIAAVVARLTMGWLGGTRQGRHLVVTAGMLVAGAVGYFALGGAFFGGTLLVVVPLLLVGTLLAFAAGWGWPGLFIFAIVRWNSNAPAAATGIVQSGVYVGAVVSPVVFGAVVTWFSWPVAWAINAGAGLLSAGLLLVGRQSLIRAVRPGAAEDPR